MTSCFEAASGTIELYFYGELDDEARAGVERHLAMCVECRHALGELRLIRAALAGRPDVSAPPGGDWTPFMTRLDAAIANERRQTAGEAGARPPLWRRPLATALAVAALLSLVTLTVAHVTRSRSAAPSQSLPGSAASPDSSAWSDDAAFAALSEEHFDRAKLVILGLANKEAAPGLAEDWQYERVLASTLLADTRLYRLAAEDRGMGQLARIMGDLELVLLQASLASDPQPETLAQIQRLIRKRDLVTRMNVMASAGM